MDSKNGRAIISETNTAKEIFKQTLSDDFEKFVIFSYGEFIKGRIPQFHTDIYNLLINEKRLCLAAPRGFAKSMICSVFYPTWLATYSKVRDICIISASEQLAIELLRKIRTCIENNAQYIDLYGDMRSAKWTESQLILSNGVTIRAKGAGGQIRGFRPEVLILDDIETDESVLSEDQRKKLKDWLFKACLNTLLPDGQFIIVGTIIHYLSVLNDLLETPNNWTKRRLTAYTDGVEDVGHELWAEQRPHEWLQQRKAEIGTFAFACFTGETSVYTKNGLKRIDEIIVGDSVLDKDRNNVSVKAIGNREVYQTYKVWLYGYDKPIECSNNHLFYVYAPQFYRNRFFCHNNIHKAVTGAGNTATLELVDTLEWKPAEQLVGNEYCVFPINDLQIETRDKEFWWTVGRFLSEGNIYKNTIQICANKKEKHYLERTLNYLNTTKWAGKRKIFDCGSTYRIYVGSKDLTKIFSKFGKKSKQKHLTEEAKNLDEVSFNYLLDGYLSGDGYVSKGQRMANSIDRQLLLDFKETLLKFEIPSYLNKVKDFHTDIIKGRVCNCQPLYHLTISTDITRAPKIYTHNGLQYSRIRNIEVVEDKKIVYDIKTEGNFMVEGAVVHNSEFMNDPKADMSAAIKQEHLRYWTELPAQYSGVIAIDPAYSDDAKADYKTASIVLIDQQHNRYLSHYLRTHMPMGEFIDAILNLYQQNKNFITGVGVPSSGTEKMFFTSLQKQAQERKIYPPFIELKNSFISASGQKITNKKARIVASLQPLFENGKYYIHESQYEARDELLTIGSSRHDDIVDTLCYAEQILTPNFEEQVVSTDRYGDDIEEFQTIPNDYGY